MTELPFEPNTFDLIWAEGSAYIMGIEKALEHWKPLLTDQGCLMVSDMVWCTEDPSQTAIDFWNNEYPDIKQVNTRLEQMEKAGYQVVAHFPQSKEGWMNYYGPLSARLDELRAQWPKLKRSKTSNTR